MKTQNTRIFGNSKQNSKKLVFRLFHLPTRNRSKYRISLAKLRMPEYRWISHENAKHPHIREFNVKLRKSKFFDDFTPPTRNRPKYRISLAKLRMPEYRWISHENAKHTHIREFNAKLKKSKFFDDFNYQPEIAQNIAFL